MSLLQTVLQTGFIFNNDWVYMGGPPKITGKTPKMDGEINGKPYVQMDDLGVPLYLETPIYMFDNYHGT